MRVEYTKEHLEELEALRKRLAEIHRVMDFTYSIPLISSAFNDLDISILSKISEIDEAIERQAF